MAQLFRELSYARISITGAIVEPFIRPSLSPLVFVALTFLITVSILVCDGFSAGTGLSFQQCLMSILLFDTPLLEFVWKLDLGRMQNIGHIFRPAEHREKAHRHLAVVSAAMPLRPRLQERLARLKFLA